MSRLNLFVCTGLAAVLYLASTDDAATDRLRLAQTGEAGGAPATLRDSDTVTGEESETPPPADLRESEAAGKAAPSVPDAEKTEAPPAADTPRQIETEARPGGPSIVAPKAERLEPKGGDQGAPASEAEEDSAPGPVPAEDVFTPAEPAEEQAAPAEPAEPAEGTAESEPAAADDDAPEAATAPDEEPATPDEAPAEAAEPAPAPEDEDAPKAAEAPGETETPGETEVSALDRPGKSEFSPEERDFQEGDAANISTPEDPTAIAALAMLDKHCARCHQSGKLKRQKAAKNFGNVLDLEGMLKDPNLILAGNPEGSRLFNQISKGEMPYDCYQEFSCPTDEPTKEEIQAVYDWIKSLGGGACGRDPIDEEDIVEAIAADIDEQQDHRQKGMRYITLAHLYNACADDKDMARFRQGVVKLLNSLSRESDVLAMRTIDEHKTIIAFNLDDLKWTEDDWNKITAAYPYGMKPDINDYESVKDITETPLAWVRGDWFAFTASRPPMYHDLLKLPDTFQALEKELGVDTLLNIEKLLAKRSGFAKSGVSKHNRLIERHSIDTGYFWTSYDFKGDKRPQSLFARPLGPGEGDEFFKHDGGESIFSLPNGFQGYYLNTEKGVRIDKGPTEIVLDDTQLDRSVTNGISCMGCHNQGIRKASDDIRKHVLADRTFDKDIRDKVDALYPPIEEMNKILDSDFNRFRAAMERSGLDPELDSQQAGVESVNFLSKQYEKAVDLKLVAAEFGLKHDEFAEGLAAAGGEAFRTRRQLEQGVVPRETIEDQFAEFVELVSDNEPIKFEAVKDDGKKAKKDDAKKAKKAKKDDGEKAGKDEDDKFEAVKDDIAKVGDKTKEETHDFALSLISDKSDYHVDDHPVFSVKSDENCNLTLINVDSSGEGVVIYPNKFQQDNFLKAGKEFEFPDEEAPFQFRLKDKGVETVIALCETGKKSSDGIEHDFKSRQFTELGNYREFLTRAIVVEGKEKVADAKKADVIDDKSMDKKNVSARTAIKLTVE